MPVVQRAALQHDEREIRRDLARLADQLAPHAGVLRRVFGREDAHAINRTAKHLGKQLAGAQQQGLHARRRVLALNQMEI